MKFYYGLTENYDASYWCEDYIAYLYKVKYIDKNRDIYEPDKNDDNNSFVMATKYPNEFTVKKDEITLVNKHLKFLPILRQNATDSKNIQRDIWVIFGGSGSGKTVFVNNVTKIYKGLNPKNKVYYISSKNMLIDPSFKKELFTFIPFHDFMEEFTHEAIKDFETNNLMDNSLIILDDICLPKSKDKGAKDLKARFYEVLDIIIKLKRMNYITLMYIMHETSCMHDTRTLFNEMTGYVVFNIDLKNRSNLILQTYLKMTKREIDIIMSPNNDSRWNLVSTRNRCIITENKIVALK